MRRSEFTKLFDELSNIGADNISAEPSKGISTLSYDAFNLVSDESFAIEIERYVTVRTEGIRTTRLQHITFQIDEQ